MGGAHSSENRRKLGFQGVRVATPISAALVGSQPGGQTTSNESRGATGYKRPRIVEFGTPYEIPMTSSGRQSVYLMKARSIQPIRLRIHQCLVKRCWLKPGVWNLALSTCVPWGIRKAVVIIYEIIILPALEQCGGLMFY
ncbi:jg12455 [Pararge aegeria aegeria]|uniref:Jg12455 protein n=1 Tax=Pararge aegeria aegeria TaxID=348720 RepID=A0A8S4RRB3_9NEOP|nr:jg12455 [Pararge aegeria aegeria]